MTDLRCMQIRAGFTDLGKTADGIGQAYLTFKLSNTCVTDLSMLNKGKHLQKLELGRNELSDLKHLCGKESLVYLNVSGTPPLLLTSTGAPACLLLPCPFCVVTKR